MLKKFFQKNTSSFLYLFFLFSFFSFLNFSSAENGSEFTGSVKGVIDNVNNDIIGTLTTTFMVLSFCVFGFGVAKFIYGRYSDKSSLGDIKKAKDFMLWGVIALFILVSIWGVIKIIQGFIGIDSSNIKVQSIQFIPPTSSSEENASTKDNTDEE